MTCFSFPPGRFRAIWGLVAMVVTALLIPAAVVGQTGSGTASTADEAWTRQVMAARDAQQVALLSRLAGGGSESNPSQGAPQELYRIALANSALAEVYLELGKKAEAAATAKQGVALLRQAVQKQPNDAEYHRLLGTLCGQVIPASPLSALSYGRCALEEIETALRLNPRLAAAYLSRGVGHYYLPPAFGGGFEKAASDVARALKLAPDSSDAHLWMGLILRRQGKLQDALHHLEFAARLAPNRDWIRQQLAKTPLPANP